MSAMAPPSSMTQAEATANADQPLLISGGPVHTADASGTTAEAIALAHGRILAVGSLTEVTARVGGTCRHIDLAGRCVVPGLIDGHAHMDREGLKTVWPSLAGLRSIRELLERIAALAASAAPGTWIVTMPLGDPPHYEGMPELLAEGRWPNRHDLDAAAPHNPVYIRPIWGYWRNKPPLISIANSLALALAGIGPDTAPPAPEVTIEKDERGEPTGVFIERTQMPIAELTLLTRAPHFSRPQRVEALARSMRAYNEVGTTCVFEGHGVAPDTIAAYRELAARKAASVRASRVFSPAWSTCGREDVAQMLRHWCQWLAGRGLGDHWLDVHGIFAEEGEAPCCEPRAKALPQTGWAGFCYDAALPRSALRELLLEAARNKIRVANIWPNVVDLFAEVHRSIPIDDQRWVWGHISILDRERIRQVRDLGLAVTTHTNRHIAKDGGRHLDRLGAAAADQIVPLRSLIEAGVPISFGSDNLPPTLFGPIHHAVMRRSEACGRIIAPAQSLTRQEALRCASFGGAQLCRREDELGTLEPGKRADLVVLPQDLMTMEADAIPALRADITIVDGKIVHG
ncbi:hypothetical protein SAMN05519104_4760 [Rhizobiales bacterium GAS188]|nr:hypothetical protein SAMN05519104_4760 [Rhizobiales bacterium GAS188]